MSRTGRLTVRRTLAIATMVVLGLGARHLLVDTLEPAEAESIIRAARARDVSAHYMPLVQSADGAYDAAVTKAFADALADVRDEAYVNVRVKRTWIPPIRVRQPTYVVAVTRQSSNEPEYYRVRGPFVRRTSRLWWMLPLL